MGPLKGDSTQPGEPGVRGDSSQSHGVLGESTSATGSAGVTGIHDEGDGPGVYGHSMRNDGLVGYSQATGKSGVAGGNDEGDGAGVYGRSTRDGGHIG